MALRPDGLVHLVKDVSIDRGSRIIAVKCGAPMPKFTSHEVLTGATGWASRVTCPACRGVVSSPVDPPVTQAQEALL